MNAPKTTEGNFEAALFINIFHTTSKIQQGILKCVEQTLYNGNKHILERKKNQTGGDECMGHIRCSILVDIRYMVCRWLGDLTNLICHFQSPTLPQCLSINWYQSDFLANGYGNISKFWNYIKPKSKLYYWSCYNGPSCSL